MRMRFIGLALTASLVAAGIASATGLTEQSPVGPRITGAPTADLAGLVQSAGLFDTSRLTTWRSYSFGMSSGGGRVTSAGLLVQHLQYQISKPLTFHAEIGLLHNPLGMMGSKSVGGPQQASLVIPAMDLIYRPSNNMIYSIHYSQTPNYGYRDPWMPDAYNTGW